MAKLGPGIVPLAPQSAVPYDEQVGMTFTQNLARLDFNVTAVEQTGPDGVGPAYLVNGLTAAGYWYQVGLSWKWPLNNGATQPGFNMNYEVFGPVLNSCQGSVYPANCGSGIDSITANQGDLVLLSLAFSNGNVIMHALDWNTNSSSTETYSAEGQTQFLGLADQLEQNGFFTGLMTEQYHTNSFNGTGKPVRYSSTTASLVSAWLWLVEGNTNDNTLLFSDNTTTPVQLNSSTGAYFGSHGTAEIADSHDLVTGITPAIFPTANSGSATGYSNHQATVSIQIANSPTSTVNLLNVTIVANFTTYHAPSSGPFTIQGTTGYNLTISLPTSLPIGNYTLRIVVSSWLYQEPQSQEWIQLQPTSFNETLRVTSAPPPLPTPTPGTPGPSGPGLPAPGPITVQSSNSLILQLWAARTLILMAGIGYIALVSMITIIVTRHEQARHSRQPMLSSTACQVCGNPISLGSLFCESCGKPTAPPAPT